MSNARRFSAINTKLRVMHSHFLTDDDYLNLMESKTVDDTIAYLENNTIYGKFITNDPHLTRIEEVDIAMDRYLVYQFGKILNYFSDKYKEFYRSLMLRYEVEDLKLFIRAVARGESLEETKNLSLIREKYYSFSYEKIKSAKNINELIEMLNDTPFYDIIKRYKDEDPERLIFYIEMSLDKFYFQTVSEKSKELSREDRKFAEKLVGTNVDLLNIEWIYRGLKFYNTIPEELINYALSGGLEFKYEDLKKLCYSDVDNLIKTVRNTPYKDLFNPDKDIDTFLKLRIQRYLYNMFKDVFKKAKMDISVSIGFLHLLEFEIRDIMTILESKRYQISSIDIKEYLIRDLKGSE